MIHIRNFRTPTLTAAWSSHATTMLIRELLLLAGWSDITLDADAAWATDLVVNEPGGAGTGFRVNAASPRVVYDPSGRFTLAMETGSYALFLYATNDQNRGAWRITRYIDANNVEIDADGAPPAGWITENSMAARIINVNGARLAASKGDLLQAPAPSNLRARVYHSTTSSCLVFARPKGGAGVATETPVAGVGVANNTDTYLRFNAILSGKDVFISWYAAAGLRFVQWGELEDVDAGDANPGFLWAIAVPAAHVCTGSMNMLSFTDAVILAYLTWTKWFTGTAVADMYYYKTFRRLLDGTPGKLHLRQPKVVLDNVAGNACVRGKMPLIRVANYYLEEYRPLDAAGAWLYLDNGLVIPRNGPNDQLPILG